jgi:hypothetical protein
MNKIPLLLVLLCVNCAAGQALQNCQKEAGPKPYAGADAFGLIGALAVNQTDDRQAWNKKVDDCFDSWKAANP